MSSHCPKSRVSSQQCKSQVGARSPPRQSSRGDTLFITQKLNFKYMYEQLGTVFHLLSYGHNCFQTTFLPHLHIFFLSHGHWLLLVSNMWHPPVLDFPHSPPDHSAFLLPFPCAWIAQHCPDSDLCHLDCDQPSCPVHTFLPNKRAEVDTTPLILAQRHTPHQPQI